MQPESLKINNNNKKQLKLIHANIRSAKQNFNQFIDLINHKSPSIAIATETWNPHSSLFIPNYHLPKMIIRQGRRGGGVAIWVRNDIQMASIDLPSCSSNIEAIGLQIIRPNQKAITIIGIYRPPSSNAKESFTDLEKIFKFTADSKVPTIIAGDLNINMLAHTKQCHDYQSLLSKYQMTQNIKNATRITRTSETLIDHIISSNIIIEASVLIEQIADHQAIEASFGHSGFEANMTKTRKFIDVEATNDSLSKLDWRNWIKEHLKSNVDEAFNDLHDQITKALEFKSLAVSRRKSPIMPWFNKDLVNIRNEVLKARQKFMKCKNEKNEILFKNLHKSYKKELRLAKQNYYHMQIKNAKKDPKKIWNILNEVTQRKCHDKTSDIGQKLIFNNHEITNHKDISDNFNEMFKNIAYEHSKSIPTPLHDFSHFLNKHPKSQAQFSFSPINENDVINITRSFKSKKSSGFDNLSNHVLKSIINTIAMPLTFIINKSLSTGQFPSLLKHAKLTPLHKTGPKDNPGNYRPISQLSPFSKLIEKVVIKQITEYSDANNIINNNQFGFRSKHSTEHAIITTRNLIENATKKGNYCVLLLLDLSKAFDTVCSTEILPAKLSHYGFDSNVINWFQTFFSQRQQTTNWHGHLSNTTTLHNISVVQGSSIGPMAFNLYINDIASAIKNQSILYADDTSIIISAQDVSELEAKANKDLKIIEDYTKANKLSINIKKTTYLIFNPKGKKSPKLNLTLSTQTLEQVHESKFLGVWIDDHLSFKTHFQHVSKKLKSTLGIICQAKKILTYSTKKLLYDSLFLSHLDYCCLVWLDKLNQKQIKQFYTIQKRTIRAIYNTKYNSPTYNMFSLSQIVRIPDYYHCKAAQFMWKLDNNELPAAVASIFPEKKPINLRCNTQNKLPLGSGLKGDLLFNLITEWNATELNTKNSFSLKRCKFNVQQCQNAKYLPDNPNEIDVHQLANYMRS